MEWSAEFLDLMNEATRVYLGSVLGATIIWIMMNALLTKRRKTWALLVFLYLKPMYMTYVLNTYLSYYYKDTDWLNPFIAVNALLALVLTVGMLSYVFKDDMLKLVISMPICEIPGVIILLVSLMLTNILEGREEIFTYGGRLHPLDICIFLFGGLLFAVLYLPARSFLKRFRTYQIRHRKILWIIFLSYYVGSLGTYFSDIKNPQEIFTTWYLFLVLWGVIALIAAGLIYNHYKRNIRTEHGYLLTQQKLMETHYMAVQMQIRRAEEGRKILNQQMEKVQAQLQSKQIQTAQVNSYLMHLRQEYDDIRAGVYCDDWMVDAVLYCQGESMKKQGIRLDCSLQGYDRGNIEAEDLVQILQLMLSEVSRVLRPKSETPRSLKEGSRTVKLQLAAVQNQLMIRVQWAKWEAEKRERTERIDRKWLKPYLKKYGGMVKAERTGNGEEVVIGLRRE